jgi:MtfA peptidase
MVFSWLKKRRRNKIAAPPLPPTWAACLAANFQHWDALDAGEKQVLEDIIQVLIAEKSWEGCNGFAITEEVQVTIAAQAGLLLIGIEHDYYQNVDSILVYPSTYKLPRSRQVGGAVSEEKTAVLGSAHHGGPVILAWDSAKAGGRDADDGRNLVYHEFAHKLDMLDGMVDGTPELEADEFKAWVEVMTAEYDKLVSRSRKGKKSVIDSYGATDVAEFFAVTTESFFEKPVRMKAEHPRLYDVMQSFYHQDPAKRFIRN